MRRPMRAIGRAAARTRAASLGGKLLLILATVGLVGSVAITVLLAAIITPSFDRLERQAIDGHVERTRVALADYARKVEGAVRDYGDWNASYDYLARPTRAFEEESFSTLAMANLDIAGMAYLRPDGGVVIARWIDGGGERADRRDALVAAVRRAPLARLIGNGSSTHFYVRLGGVVAAVAVAQVRRSDGSGASRGWVLMARPITSAQLGQLLQVPAAIDLDARADTARITPQRDGIRIAVPLPGGDGAPVARARFTVARDLSLLGRHMLVLAVAGSSGLLAIVLLVLRRMIARLVLRPLARVERHMQRVRDSGSPSVLADEAGRDDEIASLGRSFNSMLVQLKDLREQVELQSFALGRSESAVAVMHNVRNALTPVSTIISAGIAQPAPAGRATLARAIAELGRDAVPPARRAKLARFVAAAIAAEAAARDERRRELEIGRDAMRQVLEIIGAQQKLAHERPPLEPCDATKIIAQNATIARHGGGGASIAFSFPGRPHWVMANRLLLSQIIGNLFANAAEAIAAAGGEGSITVGVRDAAGEIEIAIHDSGEGFAPETAASLFQRGFSTRNHKSGGLGLHWCANSMAAMDGTLRLTSDGVGRGATALLTLKPPAAGQAVA